MHNYFVIDGDILESDSKYIAHQCNCRSNKVMGLAKIIFDKYPWADICNKGRDVKRIGKIDVRGNGEDKRYVINMFAQVYPGKINDKSKIENEKLRKKAFVSCLKEIKKIDSIDSISFPYGIGCGLAGGDWSFYERAIKAFANDCPEVKVFVLRKKNG